MMKMCVETADQLELKRPRYPTPHYARCVLDVTGDSRFTGYAGDFARQLIELALKCDVDNLDHLALGFPTAVAAVEHWRVDPVHTAQIAGDWS